MLGRTPEWEYRCDEKYGCRLVLRSLLPTFSDLIFLAELADSTNLAQAFSFMPVVWAIGATFGYVILSRCLQNL